jgi:hypothetical protein
MYVGIPTVSFRSDNDLPNDISLLNDNGSSLLNSPQRQFIPLDIGPFPAG